MLKLDPVTLKALNNAIASTRMEEFEFSDGTLKILTDYAENKIDFDELIKIITEICGQSDPKENSQEE